jgi:transglutaminase-like putative cysteine protease
MMKNRITVLIAALLLVAYLMLGGCTPSEPPQVVPPPLPTPAESAPEPTPPMSTPEDSIPTPESVPEPTPAVQTPVESTPVQPPELTPDVPVPTPTAPAPATPMVQPPAPTPTLPSTPTPTTSPPTEIITDSSVPTTANPPSPTPVSVKLPAAPGTSVTSTDKSVIDHSNASDGYIMVKYTGDRTRFVVRITTPNGRLPQYTLPTDGNFYSLILSEGNGKYTIELYEGTAGTTSVVALDKLELNVSIANANTPFLMPNYYVDFTANSSIIQKGSEVTAGKKTEIDKISAIYNWFVENVKYDDHRAATVQSGYVPNLSDLMRDKKGICFDYAAGMAAMLRSHGIPTKMVHGDANDIFHAWIITYSTETGLINGWIRFDGKSWTLMEPTWAAANGDDNKGFREFVSGGNHTAKLYF